MGVWVRWFGLVLIGLVLFVGSWTLSPEGPVSSILLHLSYVGGMVLLKTSAANACVHGVIFHVTDHLFI